MISSKSWRTNLVALLGAVIILSGIALVYFDKASFKEVMSAFGGLGMLLATISSYLGKDAKASHSKNATGGMPDPEKEEK